MSGEPARTLYCSRCLTTFPGDGERCPNLGCRGSRPAVGWGELLTEGALIDRTYRVHKLLAIGGAGVTYLAAEVGGDGVAEVGPKVAVKVLYQQRDQGPYLRRLATEAQILQGLNHPNIVECRGFVHRTGHSPYLVTRFMEGGSLLDHLRRVGTLPIPAAAGIARQVCWALEVAHRQGVVHRDLKPENVLLEAPVGRDQIPVVRVADFGIAKVYGGVGDRLTRVGAFVGTPQYAAPEQFDGLSPEPATDVYAVGALFYFCVAGRPVAELIAELEPESQKDHLLSKLPPRLDDAFPQPTRKQVEDTLAVAMALDPGDRADIGVIEQRLAALSEGRDPGFVRLPPAGVTLPPPLPPQAHGGLVSVDTLDAAAGPPLFAVPSDDAMPPLSLDTVDAAPPARTAPPPARTAPARTAPTRSTTGTHRVSASFPAHGDTLHLPPENTADVPRASSSKVGCVMGLFGLGGVVAVAGAAAAFFLLGAEPVELTAAEKDPTRARDYQLVAGTLGDRGVAAEKACGSPPYLAVEVTVEGSGDVRSAKLLNYPHAPTEACITRELQKTRFPRQGSGPVRVAVTLPR